LPAVITIAAHFPDRTTDEVPIPEACKRLEDQGASVVGLNCSRGPDVMMPLIREVKNVCKVRMIFEHFFVINIDIFIMQCVLKGPFFALIAGSTCLYFFCSDLKSSQIFTPNTDTCTSVQINATITLHRFTALNVFASKDTILKLSFFL
jgi:hypothetical protein